MDRPAYDIESEGRAFDLGYCDGFAGSAFSSRHLAKTWPNAYAKGYWTGKGDADEGKEFADGVQVNP